MSGDIDQQIEFLAFEPDDIRRLARLRPVLEQQSDRLVDAFYQHLLSFAPTRRLLRDSKVVERLLGKQRDYLLSLAGPTLDEAYVAERRRIGATHERVGLEPRWYLGAYALYLSLLTPLVIEACADDPAEAGLTLAALQRLLFFDAQLAIETYVEHSEIELQRLNQELGKAGRRLQRDYSDQQRELSETAERARAAEQLASIGILVAGLAHEIGTPMGVIQGHAKLLEGAVAGEKAQWRLHTIQEQISRISGIIQSLLDMARPKAMEQLPVDLEPLLERTLSFLSEKFSRRGVEVACDFSPAPSIVGDPERLQQLFLNLFLNAVDAMPEGGKLGVRLAQESAESLVLAISDQGTGIPENHIEQIFDPFFTSKPAGQGNGLGLTVARGIVSDHGASIYVKSAPDEGTEFQIRFPLVSAGA